MSVPIRIAALGLLCAAASAALSGCGSVGAASGALAGAATGLVTANPAVGIGVGIAVQAATDEAVNRTMKQLHQNQQDAIANAAGSLAVGEAKPWKVSNTLPLENGEGEVRVTRAYSTALALCKEFAFSVKDGDKADWYFANACQQGKQWKWASAEPAVDRWGALQ
ncbi:MULTISPECIES: hypothetical protein [Burkholderia]|uniref:Lipoprotein n=1 Tax=Burkholderia vietnamiensis (strain G4 / LMG 22486) TaxID=269482 RepID=A4JGT0_BURVG|nr:MULTISPECIES: hypothetical protein [Burkholderia]ABO55483.1 conserved hypothetical protein [Burkholderia vietnamiensis G4]AFJ86531.1 hypothetical protein MYA_2171 [Burkholderia sp. KJ006]AJY07736.1 hypothetical protein AK36_1508 [Burkholderia vietnamiensis LMG 10929]AOK41596.1 hypothetical protein WL96_11405 [Burkholderia vietnamiensis]AVR16742.1 hypothetical protein A8H33_25890 [Burkholderia vietnamiensis]